MDLDCFYTYCLSKKAATEDLPFDQDTLVFKVGGKIFAFASLKEWESGSASVSLKCNPDYAVELRATFEAVTPGYHLNKKHWNSVFFNKDLSDGEILKLIDHSYELVLASLPKKLIQTIIES